MLSVDLSPVLVLEENSSGPFSSDLYPLFVLYRDNTVFVSDGERDRARVGRVSPREARRLIEAVHAAGFDELPDHLVLSQWTHEVTAAIRVRVRGGWLVKSIYGIKPHLVNGFSTCTPPAFLEIYQQLVGYRIPGSRRWKPTEVEVQLYRYDRPPTRRWPDDLPAPPGVADGSDWLFRLPIEYAERLEALHKQMPILEIDGEPWLMIRSRAYLPGESSAEPILNKSPYPQPAERGCPSDPTLRDRIDRARSQKRI